MDPLALGFFTGLALTAGWLLRTLWAITHRIESWAWVRSAR